MEDPMDHRSAVDHILVNFLMEEGFRGKSIDENAEEINISDHNMVRSWFRIGRGDTKRWKKYEIRIRYKKDTASLEKFTTELESRLNELTSFDSYMDKIKITQDRTKKKKPKGKKKKKKKKKKS